MKNDGQLENLVLAIAIDEYSGAHRPLFNAKTDVERFVKVMKDRYNFELISPLLENGNAKRDEILEELEKLGQNTSACQNLIIYYAGHGEQDEDTGLGYWVPVDATARKWSFISNSTVNDFIKAIRAKHVLLISDCCYSGTFILQHGITDKIGAKTWLTSESSRWVLTSGEANKVSDGVKGEGSPFAQCLNTFLETNNSPVLKMTTLFDEVIENTKGRRGQRPGAAPLKDFGGITGEMTLELDKEIPKVYPDGKIDFPFPELPLPKHYISRHLTPGAREDLDFDSFFAQDSGRVYLEEVIMIHKKIVLLGGAGSGKSIELNRLALRLKGLDQPLTPILIRLNRFQGEDLSEYLPGGWEKTDPAKLIIFLDGLDEVQPAFFNRAIDTIKDFFLSNNQITAVVSCRTSFYQASVNEESGTLGGFHAYFINEPSVKVIKSTLELGYEIDSEDFMNKIYEYELLDLIQKPFFLRILIAYYLENKNFRGGRAGIMEASLIDQDKGFILKSSRGKRDLATLFSRLEKIAFIMELAGKNYLSAVDLKKLFSDSEEYQECRFLPAFNHNIDDDTWSFEHNNIQEYLASRVLSRQPFEKLQALLFVESLGTKRVKPTWINTLSFLISINKGEAVARLVNEILEEDQEVIVKFESDRFDQAERTEIFKRIFNFYTDKEMWVSSNKFSPADLARFGRTQQTLVFLKKVLADTGSHRMKKVNAVYHLLYFDFRGFEKEALEFQEMLFSALLHEDIAAEDAHRIMSLLARLPVAKEDQIEQIVQKFKKHKNQYLRAGLYELIGVSDAPERFIAVLMDGLSLAEISEAVEDRENFSLGDEDYHWEVAFKKIMSVTGIQSVFKILIDNPQKRLSLVHNQRESLIALVQNAGSAYHIDRNVFSEVFELVILMAKQYEEHSVKLISVFFKETATHGKALSLISLADDDEFYYLHDVVINLIDRKALDEWIAGWSQSNVNVTMLNFVHQYLWEQRDGDALAQEFDDKVKQIFSITLTKPIAIQRPDIWEQRLVDNFYLLFRSDLIKPILEHVFERLAKEEITREDVAGLSKANFKPETLYIPNIALNILRRFTYNNRICHRSEILNWIDAGLSFIGFQIEQIHQHLKNHRQLQVSAPMIDFIRNWTVLRGNSSDIAWYFLQRFKFKMPTEKILDFTCYYNFGWELGVRNSGGIEVLEELVGLAPLILRVNENIINPELQGFAWLGNASYALRKKIQEAFPNIIKRLQESREDDYRYEELLSFWFDLTGDWERLETFIESVWNRSLRLKAIELLSSVPKESTVLHGILIGDLGNDHISDQDRLIAANYLIKMGDSAGFDFLFKELMARTNEAFDYRNHLFGFEFIDTIGCLDRLLILLKRSKISKYPGDIFNNLESRVLEALNSIALVSEENYRQVKSAIEDMMDRVEEGTDWSNLYYFIRQLDDQNISKKTIEVSVDEAMRSYHEFQL
ncbi:caspase family protein [Pedobacter soli]|uniref:Caspase domain-containing protein n=1 Tax=Pedobacter soli TaxID=390242 RepID=A0A1G6K1F6_9SPHI|nr:caspase family protein [Pedobacter soli]SDC24116.1 Caspase domain-containing protein [Pedobacter soli]